MCPWIGHLTYNLLQGRCSATDRPVPLSTCVFLHLGRFGKAEDNFPFEVSPNSGLTTQLYSTLFCCRRTPQFKMNVLKMRKAVLKEAVKRFPWLANVTLYGCLFAGGDFVHQMIAQREEMDWKHTRNVAIVAISFHGNFNYFWLRALESRFPGKSPGMLFRKLLLDQSFASPLATSVFYTGNVHFTVESLIEVYLL